jgi:hypothetical protein
MAHWLMYDELKRIWKEAILASLRKYPGICLEGLRKTKKILCKGSPGSYQGSKQDLDEYEFGTLPLR